MVNLLKSLLFTLFFYSLIACFGKKPPHSPNNTSQNPTRVPKSHLKEKQEEEFKDESFAKLLAETQENTDTQDFKQSQQTTATTPPPLIKQKESEPLSTTDHKIKHLPPSAESKYDLTVKNNSTELKKNPILLEEKQNKNNALQSHSSPQALKVFQYSIVLDTLEFSKITSNIWAAFSDAQMREHEKIYKKIYKAALSLKTIQEKELLYTQLESKYHYNDIITNLKKLVEEGIINRMYSATSVEGVKKIFNDQSDLIMSTIKKCNTDGWPPELKKDEANKKPSLLDQLEEIRNKINNTPS